MGNGLDVSPSEANNAQDGVYLKLNHGDQSGSGPGDRSRLMAPSRLGEGPLSREHMATSCCPVQKAVEVCRLQIKLHSSVLASLASTCHNAFSSIALQMPSSAPHVPSPGRPAPSIPSWTDIIILQHVAMCLLPPCFSESPPCPGDCPFLPLGSHSTLLLPSQSYFLVNPGLAPLPHLLQNCRMGGRQRSHLTDSHCPGCLVLS